MTADSAEARPVAEWLRVLERIEEALARRQAEVQEPPPAGDPAPAEQSPLHALDARLAQMQSRLDQAERDAAEADEVLRVETEAYQSWTERMTAARRRLGDWAAHAK